MNPIWTMQPLKPVGSKVEVRPIVEAPIANDTETPKFDRGARMREYWAKRRAEKEVKGEPRNDP